MRWPFQPKKIKFDDKSMPEPIPYCEVHDGCSGYLTKKDGEEIPCPHLRWECAFCDENDFVDKTDAMQHMVEKHPDEYQYD